MPGDWERWQAAQRSNPQAKYKVGDVKVGEDTSPFNIIVNLNVLDMLANFESLRQFHLLIPDHVGVVSNLNTMLTFQYVLKKKKGAPLERMMISSEWTNWEVSRASDHRVLLTTWCDQKETVEVVWDLEMMAVCSRVERSAFWKPRSEFSWPNRKPFNRY
jgi:hypothetical protein